jgi:hypothetical protein
MDFPSVTAVRSLNLQTRCVVEFAPVQQQIDSDTDRAEKINLSRFSRFGFVRPAEIGRLMGVTLLL